MKKIYSILVAYNPDLAELNQAVERLKKQTDIVIVCNNSNYDVKFEDEQVKVFNFGENLGIAKAQSIGMKWAFENGADFILQMDQDSILEDRTVERLLNSFNKLTSLDYKVGVICATPFDKRTQEVYNPNLYKGTKVRDTKIIIKREILSSTSLIPKEAYLTVGGMMDELFIDAVDFEYCWRLKERDFICFQDKSILFGHMVGNGKIKFLGISFTNPSPIRHYYHTRNIFLLSRYSYVPFSWKVLSMLKLFIKLPLYPFIFKDGKDRLKFILKGIKDGIMQRNGKL